MEQIIKEHSKENDDSLGGIVTCVCRMIPKDLEEQLFKRFKSIVSYYLMSIPGVMVLSSMKDFLQPIVV